MKLLLYCTKSKPYLYGMFSGVFCESKYGYHLTNDNNVCESHHRVFNGKIVAECDFEVEEILYSDETDIFWTKTLREEELCERSCLEQEDLSEYLNLIDSYSGNSGYAIHIKNLHIFDKPRELFNYETQEIWNNTSHYHRTIMKAPQNMMHCYGINTGDKYILISIRPEWLCKILNGEKTIEVRKKVLRQMLEDDFLKK